MPPVLTARSHSITPTTSWLELGPQQKNMWKTKGPNNKKAKQPKGELLLGECFLVRLPRCFLVLLPKVRHPKRHPTPLDFGLNDLSADSNSNLIGPICRESVSSIALAWGPVEQSNQNLFQSWETEALVQRKKEMLPLARPLSDPKKGSP